MSDIFREVEEEVRRERFERIWKQYGDYIIAAVALVVIAVAGFELWQRYEANQKLKASETFIAAQQLADSGNVNQASAAFGVIARDAPDGYAKLARLSQAGVLEISGQRIEALAIFKSIAKDDDGLIGSVARLRGGWILAADGPRADLDQLIAPLTDPASPWRFSAREVLAYADFHAGLNAKAQSEFASLGNDKDASIPLRRRCSAMAMFLKNGGMANYGKVPPPAQPAPTTPAAP